MKGDAWDSCSAATWHRAGRGMKRGLVLVRTEAGVEEFLYRKPICWTSGNSANGSICWRRIWFTSCRSAVT